jgi:hypothetical protein
MSRMHRYTNCTSNRCSPWEAAHASSPKPLHTTGMALLIHKNGELEREPSSPCCVGFRSLMALPPGVCPLHVMGSCLHDILSAPCVGDFSCQFAGSFIRATACNAATAAVKNFLHVKESQNTTS